MNKPSTILNQPVESRDSFEEEYLALRRREGRLYTDEELENLPHVPSDHPYAGEWRMRARSAHRLYRYLLAKNKPLRILDAGCGNGWLAHYLSRLPVSYVAGMDVNRVELNQATRVFHHCNNLGFVYGDLRKFQVFLPQFDIIVFAASIQYFPSPEEIIQTAFRHLRQDGEVHLLDTHFYRDKELAGAKERSRAYYSKIGASGMEDHYFHHTLSALDSFNATMLFDPGSFWNRIREHHPFYWIRIKPT